MIKDTRTDSLAGLVDLMSAALKASPRLQVPALILYGAHDDLIPQGAVSRFVVDSSWDRPTHPEGWYFRSDHVPYAERGVPSLFFSTNLHPDYHTPRDEPQRIDYPKLTRMTQWMYMTGWIAANAAKRPATDPGFVLH